MEITGKPPLFAPPATAAYKDDGLESVPSQPDEAQNRTDTVDLSTNASEIRKMVQKVNTIPDVREDKVAEMKQRIASGAYRFRNDRIASQLVGETLENNAVLNHIDSVDD